MLNPFYQKSSRLRQGQCEMFTFHCMILQASSGLGHLSRCRDVRLCHSKMLRNPIISPKYHNIFNILGYQSYYIPNKIYIYLIYPQHYPYGIFVPQELKNGTCILAGAWGRQFDSLTVHIYRFRNSKLPTLNIPHTKMAIDNLHWFWGPKL
jgi:hypothetical protein